MPASRSKDPHIRWAKIVGITAILTIAAFYSYYPFSGAARQKRNMAAVESYLPKLTPLIKADPRFMHVKPQVFTGYDGSLLMMGGVLAEKDLSDLKKVVESTSPPVMVIWKVDVVPADILDEYDHE